MIGLLQVVFVLIIRASADDIHSTAPSHSDDDAFSYYRLESIAGLNGPRCPRACLCGTGTSQPPLAVKGYFATASCVSRKLKSIPVGFPPDIRILIARGNALTVASLANSALPLLNELDLSFNLIVDVHLSAERTDNLTSEGLRYINLNHNIIEHLSNVSFAPDGSRLPRLEVLLLSHNRISSIDPGCFAPLVGLRWLSLTGNRLVSLPAEVFIGLQSLTNLELDQNWLSHIGYDGDNLTQIPTELSTTMTSLRSLNLTANRIERISAQAFVDVAPSLEQLNLGFNKMRTVPTVALRMASFRRLRRLVLNGNPFTTLTTRCLERFVVSTLEVSHMPLLTAVERYAFYNIRGLTDIRLHDNPALVYVDADMVGQTNVVSGVSGANQVQVTGDRGIKILRLHRNRLTAIESLLNPDRMPGLELLTLYGNPLRCDCHINWIIEQLQRNSSRLRITNGSNRNDDQSTFCKRFVDGMGGLAKRESSTNADMNAGVSQRQTATPLVVKSNNFSETAEPSEPDNVTSASASSTPSAFDVTSLRPDSLSADNTTDMALILSTSAPHGFACPPIVVTSRKFIYSAVGDIVEFDCHVVNARLKGVQWTLPGGKVTNATQNNSNMRMTASGSLVIVGVKSSDAGKYICSETNSTMASTSPTEFSDNEAVLVRLVVYSPTVHLMIVAVGSDYVSMTWIGIEQAITSAGSARYAVVYRLLPTDKTSDENRMSPIDSSLRDDDYADEYYDNDRGGDEADYDDAGSEMGRRFQRSRTKIAEKVPVNRTWCIDSSAPSHGECLQGAEFSDLKIAARRPYRKATDIRPYMHGYWVGGLSPGMRYEFCIGIIRHDSDDHSFVTSSGASRTPSSSSVTIQLINCTVAVTTTRSLMIHRRSEQMFADDLEDSDMVVVFVTGGVFAAVCLVPGSVGLLSAAIRRRQRRKEYAEPHQQTGNGQSEVSYHNEIVVESEFGAVVDFGGDPMATTFDAQSPLPSIPLENLYQVTSSPFMTSRMSLIS